MRFTSWGRFHSPRRPIYSFINWKPTSISWWVTSFNLLGCIGFMSSALFAIVLPGQTNVETGAIATALTLLGAIWFLPGSCLMLLEAISGGAMWLSHGPCRS